MVEIKIPTPENYLGASLFEPREIRGLIVVASATGVRREFYQKFASYLCEHGFAVITFDYTGIGGSLNQPIRQITKGVEDWGRTDLNAVLQYGMERYPQTKKLVMGHSIGGQIIGLAPRVMDYDGIVLMTAQSGYWKHWTDFGRVKMWFNWHVLFPTLLRAFGYLPSKRLTGMEDLPVNVAKQWSTWGKHPEYLLGHLPTEKTYYQKFSKPISSFIVEDDDLGPQSASDWLLAQYSLADRNRILLRPEDLGLKGIGHFGLFKEKHKEVLWPLVLDEIEERFL